MLFHSIEFAFFFPLVVALYFATPYRHRWALLLAASYWFYMAWKPIYVVLLLTTTLVAYVAGLGMDRATAARGRRGWLLVSLFINLGLLFTFKYFNLFSSTTESLLQGLGSSSVLPRLDVLLPVGISFYTFQTLSYSIDVYRGQRRAERHLGIFALYVSFFPQLVAGPIERSTRLLPQFRERFDFDYRRVTDGLKLMVWGFFKKLVIADRLAIYVDQVYNTPTEYAGLPLLLATFFFAYQIYCDFSGYSDIAIGASQVFGYDLMQNFRQPYFAHSVQDFWRRWHVSLSTWFRDYLYVPLGGNRCSTSRWYTNLFIVFVISGLWHGANWTFVSWGALHGAYLVIGLATHGMRERAARAIGLASLPLLHSALRTATTFVLVLFAWIFFRAATMHDALYIAGNLFAPSMPVGEIYLGLGAYEFWIGVAGIVVLEAVHLVQRRVPIRETLASRPAWLRWSLYYAAVTLLILFAEPDGGKFLYFQF